MTRPLLLCSLAIALGAIACGEEAVPVGRVEIEPAEIRLRYPGFSEYRLSWTAEESLEGRELRAAVHLMDAEDEVLRTFDHPIDFEWVPGVRETRQRMLYQSALAPPLQAGSYRLRVRLYDSAGSGWMLTSNDAVVTVEDATPGFPAFYFSPEWEPIEGGTDLQILGRRWLRTDGVLRLGELTEPGTLWLQLAIPSPIEGEQELQLDPEAEVPTVVVHDSCSGREETLTGSGSHQLMLRIVPPADPKVPPECEISIVSNYSLFAVEDRVRRTVALESLSWLTGGG